MLCYVMLWICITFSHQWNFPLILQVITIINIVYFQFTENILNTSDSFLIFLNFKFYSNFTALKVVASKVILAVRVDSYQNSTDSLEGQKLRRDLEEKLEKIQEPLKAKTKKALPIPEEKKRSKRGGRRVRKMKERYAVTDLQSQQNKISFSLNEGEYGDSAMGVDKGMIGSKDGGRIRAPQKKENKVGLSKKQKTSMVRKMILNVLN